MVNNQPQCIVLFQKGSAKYLSAAILPFFLYLIIQFLVAAAGLNVVREQEIGISGCLKSWILGQIICFAVLQLMAVPMILMRLKFDVLFWTFFGTIALLCWLGLCKLCKKRIKIRIRMHDLEAIELFLLMVVVLLILWQAGTYFFGIHLDEDDARWLAEANDALYTGDMMTRSYYTGEYVGTPLMMEDVTSPWPLLFAVLSRILLNTRVSIVAHTIYPTLEIVLVYCIFWLIGREFFEKRTARLTFVLMATIVTLFYGITGYSQGVFILVRIWQGKATVAGVAIPLLLYLFICINKNNKLSDWMLVALVGAASCIMSGMGIIISGVMIGVYGLYNIIAYQNSKRIVPWIVALIPSVVFLLVNYYLRG